MVIHGVGYRPLSYVPAGVWQRIWPLAAIELRALFRHKLGFVLYLLLLGPTLFSLGLLLVNSGVWQLGGPEGAAQMMARAPARWRPDTLEFFTEPVLRDSFVMFLLVTTAVSCRAIAKDRMTNALEILWTRSVTPVGYFVAKWLGSFLLVGIPFVAAPLLLWVLAVLMAPDWGYLQQTAWFVPRLALALAAFTGVLTYVAVAFSALLRHANAASIAWFFLMIGTNAVGHVLGALLSERWLRASNPWEASKRVAEAVLGIRHVHQFPVEVALASVVGLLALLTLGLWRRLRLVEAVA